MTIGDRVEILYPARAGEKGVITRIVPRDNSPSLVRVLLDIGTGFICDETLIRRL